MADLLDEPRPNGMSSREKLTRIVTLVEVMREDVADLKTRVHAVERWMYIQIGAAAVVGGGTGYVASLFGGG